MKTYAIDRAGTTLYLNAEWDPGAGQFKSTDVPLEVSRSVSGYRYTFARSLEGLIGMGVRVYRSLEAARRQAI